MAPQLRKVIGLLRGSARVSGWAGAHLAKEQVDNFFDLIVTPIVLAWATAQFGLMGPLIGTVIMIGVNGIVCLFALRLYDWAKKDVLGLETMKSLRERPPQGLFEWLVHPFVRMGGDVGAFIALSILDDAFVTTAYLRKGAHQYNGLSARDWWIFTASLFFSTVIWSICVTVLGSVLVLVHAVLPAPMQEWLTAVWNGIVSHIPFL